LPRKQPAPVTTRRCGYAPPLLKAPQIVGQCFAISVAARWIRLQACQADRLHISRKLVQLPRRYDLAGEDQHQDVQDAPARNGTK
jgi:hypothetical protein